MQEALSSPLTAWHTFYGIIGSAAATLMGLVFVVITLLAGIRTRVASSSGVAIFNTPSVVHFSTALFVAALLSAPWPSLWPAGLLLGLVGLGGAAYTIIVFWRVRHRQMAYQLVLEDWLWHIILPLISYAGLIGAAILLAAFATPALFVIATAVVLLLFIGIHNAWDNVTYTVIMYLRSQNQRQG